MSSVELYIEKLAFLRENLLLKLDSVDSSRGLEDFRSEVFGKSSPVSAIMSDAVSSLGCDSGALAKVGKSVGDFKHELSTLFGTKAAAIRKLELDSKLSTEFVDLTLPSIPFHRGSIHPLTKVRTDVVRVFSSMGFCVVDGPEVESSYYVFDALNTPYYHPARRFSDSFYVRDAGVVLDKRGADANPEVMLRTHTTSVQVRVLESSSMPVRVLSPGRVYRNDCDSTHSPMFFQVEGLLVDKDVVVGNLFFCLVRFLRALFGDSVVYRFRSSYFPFTEPSFEVDIKSESGTWMEILGCGMVHKNVLLAAGVDPGVYSGFAFGIGLDRLVMLKLGLSDIRHLYVYNGFWNDVYGFSCTSV